MKPISTLQFITPQPTDTVRFYQLIEAILSAGINWIQYRDKKNEVDLQKQIATKTFAICKKYNATFIINDNVALASELNADGVHIGQGDMSIANARQILGNDKIIGTSTNSFLQIQKALADGADYAGIGPFRFTTTKEKLNLVLGEEKLNAIFKNVIENKIELPLVVIGGIDVNDLHLLHQCGAKGVAVSSAISNAADVAASCKAFLHQLPQVYF